MIIFWWKIITLTYLKINLKTKITYFGALESSKELKNILKSFLTFKMF